MKHIGCIGDNCPICERINRPGWEAVKAKLTPPGLVQRLVTAATAVVKAVASGFARVSETTAASRLAICEQCEHNDKQKGMCKVCTCYLSLKIPLATESCPIGKWPAEVGGTSNCGGCK